jgi:predicted oxidoreductase
MAGAFCAEPPANIDSALQTLAKAILLAWLLKNLAKIQPVLGTTRPARLRARTKALSSDP